MTGLPSTRGATALLAQGKLLAPPHSIHYFGFGSNSGADDGARTRDLRLGKATLYQLSYIRRGYRKGK